ncbi:MAG: alanine racemase [Lentisphaerae bacterium]|nr:alanine racemase [Lentisphaerota bacterium]
MNRDFSCRARLEIDPSAIKANVKALQSMSQKCDVLGVVKANAYGLGTHIVVPALLECGVKILGAATLEEAVDLLKYNVEVRILSGLMPEEIAPAIELGVTLPVIDFESACIINAEAARQKRKATVQIAIDSGMGRVGVPLCQARETVAKILQLEHLEVTGLYSHFPKAEPGDTASLEQISGMKQLAGAFQLPQYHLAASEGTLFMPGATQTPFNLIRLGIAMYGVLPGVPLQGAVKFKSRLAAVRRCQAGGTVSYGRLHTLSKETLVGTVAAGYADGVPLQLTNKGFFRVNGKLCPILGRVTMDYTMICLDDVPEAKIGDEVELFTSTPEDEINLVHWSNYKRTHAWDILCSISPRVKRVVTA